MEHESKNTPDITQVKALDSLGRVVINKDMRRAMGLGEGDKVRITSTANGEAVMIRKYEPLEICLKQQAERYAPLLAERLGRPVAICDLQRIIASAGIDGSLVGRSISTDLRDLVQERQLIVRDHPCQLLEDDTDWQTDCIAPIFGRDRNFGAILLFFPKEKEPAMDSNELTFIKKLLSLIAELIADEVEETE